MVFIHIKSTVDNQVTVLPSTPLYHYQNMKRNFIEISIQFIHKFASFGRVKVKNPTLHVPLTKKTGKVIKNVGFSKLNSNYFFKSTIVLLQIQLRSKSCEIVGNEMFELQRLLQLLPLPSLQ